MLTPEFMGFALLAISWMTGLMIALDALIDARRLSALQSSWDVNQGVVKTDELAAHEVEQRVKELDGDSPGLVFFDRKHTSVVKGGVVTLDGADVNVTGASEAEVWFDAATRAASAACSDAAAFDAMQKGAKGAGGVVRTVRTTLRNGQPVWMSGTRSGDSFSAKLISGFDPRSFIRARLAAIWGTVLLSTLWVAAGTALALAPLFIADVPAFGLISIIGAVTLIAHFIGMTPLAMANREKSRLPSIAYVRGTWKRDALKQEADAAQPAPTH